MCSLWCLFLNSEKNLVTCSTFYSRDHTHSPSELVAELEPRMSL